MARPDRPRWQPRKPGERWQPPIPGASPALKALVSGRRDPLVDAIMAGLLLRPALADSHGDALAALRLAAGDMGDLLAGILDVVAQQHDIRAEGLLQALAERGLADRAAAVRQRCVLMFSFTRADTTGAIAGADFAMALAQATARAGLEQALTETTLRFQSRLSDEDYEAQQALRAEIAALDAAMMRLAESRREA